MKKLLFLAALILSTQAWAETYLVYHVSQNVRIVLNKRACLVPNLNGNAAVIQNIKGQYIQGCWHVDRNNSNHVRIDWNNPAAPGDFSVIEANKFEPVTE